MCYNIIENKHLLLQYNRKQPLCWLSNSKENVETIYKHILKTSHSIEIIIVCFLDGCLQKAVGISHEQ